MLFKIQEAIILEDVTLENYYWGHNTVMRSDSPETAGVSAPNTKELGRTDLQRQAVMKQGVAFSVVLKTKQQNKF